MLSAKEIITSTPDSVEDAYRAALAYSLLPPNQVEGVVAHWEHSTPDVTSAGFVVKLMSGVYRYIAFTRETSRLAIIIEKSNTEPVHLYKRASNWNFEVAALNVSTVLALPTEHDKGWRKVDGKNIEQPVGVVTQSADRLTGVSIGTAAIEDDSLLPG